MRIHSILPFFSLFACAGALAQNGEEQVTDCFDSFFARAEKPAAPARILLTQKDGKVTSLQTFLGKLGAPELEIKPEYGLADLDRDGKKELVIYNFTGGAHCCDEFYFYSSTGPNRFKYAARTFGGDVCINDSNQFIYAFYEQFGYFYTCFACSYEDSSDAGPLPVHEILLKYAKGKLLVVAPDSELQSRIRDNLSKLGEQPYEKLEDETSFDNGLRKEFAMNLAVYYYSYGKNLVATQNLFYKYYRFPDAKKVWTAFQRQLLWMKKDNEF